MGFFTVDNTNRYTHPLSRGKCCSKLTNFDKGKRNIFYPKNKHYLYNFERNFSMLKGVNKQILEVSDTDSPYFEKIIFFVRPTPNGFDEKKLRDEAKRFSSVNQKPPRQKRSLRQFVRSLAYLALGLGAGTATAFILNNLL